MLLRTLAGIAATGILVAVSYAGMNRSPARPLSNPPADNAVVVAELFTSEGCSSCPPADTLLSALIHRQPVPGVVILGLSEHVDYWNSLGWQDPYSSSAFSSRQSGYQAAVFRTSSVYTPQLVIDGHLEEIGSDSAAVERALAIAAQDPKAAIELDAVRIDDAGALRIRIEVAVPPSLTMHGPADLLVAVTEDELVSNVPAGENRGRRLTHSAVVRVLTTVDTLSPGTKRWSTITSVSVRPEWKSGGLKVVAFLQEQRTRRIIGAGVSDLAARPAAQ